MEFLAVLLSWAALAEFSVRVGTQTGTVTWLTEIITGLLQGDIHVFDEEVNDKDAFKKLDNGSWETDTGDEDFAKRWSMSGASKDPVISRKMEDTHGCHRGCGADKGLPSELSAAVEGLRVNVSSARTCHQMPREVWPPRRRVLPRAVRLALASDLVYIRG